MKYKEKSFLKNKINYLLAGCYLLIGSNNPMEAEGKKIEVDLIHFDESENKKKNLILSELKEIEEGMKDDYNIFNNQWPIITAQTLYKFMQTDNLSQEEVSFLYKLVEAFEVKYKDFKFEFNKKELEFGVKLFPLEKIKLYSENKSDEDKLEIYINHEMYQEIAKLLFIKNEEYISKPILFEEIPEANRMNYLLLLLALVKIRTKTTYIDKIFNDILPHLLQCKNDAYAQYIYSIFTELFLIVKNNDDYLLAFSSNQNIIVAFLSHYIDSLNGEKNAEIKYNVLKKAIEYIEFVTKYNEYIKFIEGNNECIQFITKHNNFYKKIILFEKNTENIFKYIEKIGSLSPDEFKGIIDHVSSLDLCKNITEYLAFLNNIILVFQSKIEKESFKPEVFESTIKILKEKSTAEVVSILIDSRSKAEVIIDILFKYERAIEEIFVEKISKMQSDELLYLELAALGEINPFLYNVLLIEIALEKINKFEGFEFDKQDYIDKTLEDTYRYLNELKVTDYHNKYRDKLYELELSMSFTTNERKIFAYKELLKSEYIDIKKKEEYALHFYELVFQTGDFYAKVEALTFLYEIDNALFEAFKEDWQPDEKKLVNSRIELYSELIREIDSKFESYNLILQYMQYYLLSIKYAEKIDLKENIEFVSFCFRYIKKIDEAEDKIDVLKENYLSVIPVLFEKIHIEDNLMQEDFDLLIELIINSINLYSEIGMTINFSLYNLLLKIISMENNEYFAKFFVNENKVFLKIMLLDFIKNIIKYDKMINKNKFNFLIEMYIQYFIEIEFLENNLEVNYLKERLYTLNYLFTLSKSNHRDRVLYFIKNVIKITIKIDDNLLKENENSESMLKSLFNNIDFLRLFFKKVVRNIEFLQDNCSKELKDYCQKNLAYCFNQLCELIIVNEKIDTLNKIAELIHLYEKYLNFLLVQGINDTQQYYALLQNYLNLSKKLVGEEEWNKNNEYKTVKLCILERLIELKDYFFNENKYEQIYLMACYEDLKKYSEGFFKQLEVSLNKFENREFDEKKYESIINCLKLCEQIFETKEYNKCIEIVKNRLYNVDDEILKDLQNKYKQESKFINLVELLEEKFNKKIREIVVKWVLEVNNKKEIKIKEEERKLKEPYKVLVKNVLVENEEEALIALNNDEDGYKDLWYEGIKNNEIALKFYPEYNFKSLEDTICELGKLICSFKEMKFEIENIVKCLYFKNSEPFREHAKKNNTFYYLNKLFYVNEFINCIEGFFSKKKHNAIAANGFSGFLGLNKIEVNEQGIGIAYLEERSDYFNGVKNKILNNFVIFLIKDIALPKEHFNNILKCRLNYIGEEMKEGFNRYKSNSKSAFEILLEKNINKFNNPLRSKKKEEEKKEEVPVEEVNLMSAIFKYGKSMFEMEQDLERFSRFIPKKEEIKNEK